MAEKKIKYNYNERDIKSLENYMRLKGGILFASYYDLDNCVYISVPKVPIGARNLTEAITIFLNGYSATNFTSPAGDLNLETAKGEILPIYRVKRNIGGLYFPTLKLARL